MQKPRVALLFLFAKIPFWIGVYDENSMLIDSINIQEGKASDVLPLQIEKLLEIYEPVKLMYANGPGNQMSIKICYVSLKALSIANAIPLVAANSFEFNSSGPIELTNNRFFCFENDKIILKFIEDISESPLVLPSVLEQGRFSDASVPLYVLPPA